MSDNKENPLTDHDAHIFRFVLTIVYAWYIVLCYYVTYSVTYAA